MTQLDTTNNAIGEYIAKELRRRGYDSIERAADWLEMSKSNLYDIINGKRKTPTLEFLKRFSRKTDTPLVLLIELVEPGTTGYNLEALLLFDKFRKLPSREREIVEGFLDSIARRGEGVDKITE